MNTRMSIYEGLAKDERRDCRSFLRWRKQQRTAQLHSRVEAMNHAQLKTTTARRHKA